MTSFHDIFPPIKAFDEAFETKLSDAIWDAIERTSMVSDAAIVCHRTKETRAALLTHLAGALAMSR